MKSLPPKPLTAARSFHFYRVVGCSVALFWLTTPLTLGQETLPDEPTALPPAAQSPAATESPANTEEGSQPTLAEVRKALRELESDTLQTRDAAEQTLIGLGGGVLPYLPEVTSRTSGELKVRLQRIRQALQQTNITAFFEASTVTLQGELSVADAIAKITEQTGNTIRVEGGEGFGENKITFAAEGEPFWSVINQLMSQAQLRINAFGTTQSELVLAPRGGTATETPPAVISGPFRLEVVSIQSSLPFASPLGGQLDLSIQVAWEPRLEPVFMQLPMESVQLKLANGDSLAASNPQAAPEIPLNLGGCTTQIDLQVARPDRSASLIELLSGKFVIAVPSERHQYVFQKFGNGARQSEKFGEVNVTLEGARRNGAVYEMRVFVEFGDSQGALDSFRGWILSNEAYLLDANDNRLENVGLQTYAITPNAVGIAYLFQINGDPDDFKLIYESPAAIRRQQVEYQLKEIPLP